ncbi:MAG: polyhydroxyalkanoate synthesis regulator DNA-binding domain-containing protein [Desulfobacterales bacterium]
MRTIKKYVNRKLYDTLEKSYITMEGLAELIRSGEEVVIIDNRTKEDITAAVLTQLLAREDTARGDELPTRLLFKLLQKGGDALGDYARKYAAFGHSALTLAESEIERRVNKLIRNRELTARQGRQLSDDLKTSATQMKNWVGGMIEQRLDDLLDAVNLPNRDQVDELNRKIDALTRKVDRLEKE